MKPLQFPSLPFRGTARASFAATLSLGCACLLSACGGGGGGGANATPHPTSSTSAVASAQRTASAAPASAPVPKPALSPAPSLRPALATTLRPAPVLSSRSAPVVHATPVTSAPKPVEQPRTASAPSPAASAATSAIGISIAGLPQTASLDFAIGGLQYTTTGKAPEVAVTTKAAVGSTLTLTVTQQPLGATCAASNQVVVASPGSSRPIIHVHCDSASFAYTLDKSGKIEAWKVDSDGSLSSMPGYASISVTGATAIKMGPANHYLYVATPGKGIATYSIGADAKLSFVTTAPLPTGAKPVAMAVAPGKNLLFVACSGTDLVRVYTFDHTNGHLQDYGAVGTLLPKGALPPSGKASDGLPHARTGAHPSRLLYSSASGMLYVATADGRIEAFQVLDPPATTGDVLPGQVSPPSQSKVLDWKAEVQPFQHDGTVSMACADTACTDLVAASSNSSHVYVMHSAKGIPDANWKEATMHTFHMLTTPVPQALAIDPATGTAYVARALPGVSTAIDEYRVSGSSGASTPGLTSLKPGELDISALSKVVAFQFSRDGKTLYGVDPDARKVQAFRVNRSASPGEPLGLLTAVGQDLQAPGLAGKPVALALSH